MASTKLTRSDLERKKRDELDSIARAMGGKPSSQARKSEIVDLIMNLTGMNGSAAASDAASDTASDTVSDAASDNHIADYDSGYDGEGTAHFGGEDEFADSEAPGADDVAGADGVAIEDIALDGRASPAQRSSSRGSPDSRTSASSRTADRDSGPPRVFRFDPGEDLADDDFDLDDDSASQAASAQDSPAQDGTSQDSLAQDGPAQGSRSPQARSDSPAQSSPAQAKTAQDDAAQARSSQANQDQSNDQRRRNRRRNRQQNDEHPTHIIDIEGHLDLRDDGYGFLRVKGNLPTKSDVYVSVKQVKQFGLRKGDRVRGASRPSAQNEKNPALLRIDLVNGNDPELARDRSEFGQLTPLFPDERLRLEREGDPINMTTRIVDLLSPIGKGQRGLIVSPPKAGKTTIMKEIARSIEINNPEVVLLVLLVDERPEEVTDMRRWLRRSTSEVIASTFDRPASEHTYIAEMAIERAKRMVEEGRDVVIILDGITRLARAYNLTAPPTGRLMSGGLDAAALYPPKKFFGAARNVEEGGSLTILGTALVETGSKMDEVIFEEFKGTGNMELRLDRRSAERRIYPAIDVDASSTRHEELLFEREQLQQVWKLRRVLSGLASENDGHGAAGLELLIDRLKQFPSNNAFLSEVAQGQMRT